ncbi:CHAT domain-containing tetratricopeptide repeat protein [uncultured Sunxiuqinia sp.]|uniref:CHAT domain-containing protein n=1 Tax=uncultured Sunxiuqinia sp. TaxID=1573825 RepID=UPI0026017F35|nr:CHAT domain-containing tetratricopeptide repeat protein [uncultured Sunxiuqinia sp.]
MNSIYSYAANARETLVENDSLRVIESYENGLRVFRLGDFEQSVEFYNQALSLGRNTFGELSVKLFSSLVNLGIAYKNLGEYDKAIATYLEAERIIKSVYSENHPRLGFVYSNLGIIYKLKGDFVKNYEFQQAALRAFQIEEVKYANQVIIVEYNVSEALFLIGAYESAIQSCINNVESVPLWSKTFYFSLLARIYTKLGDYDLTKKYYQKTFDILTQISGSDSYDLGLEYSDYASFLLSINEYDEALEYVNRSEGLVVKYFTEKSLQYSDVMLNFGDYYFQRNSKASDLNDFYSKRKKDLLIALDYYQKALIAGTDGFASLETDVNPDLGQEISEIQLLEVLKKKANCFETLADLNLSESQKETAIENYTLALQTVERATELIHQIRTGYVSEDSQFFLSENQESTFIEAVDVSYKLFLHTGDFQFAEKGFEFAEKSKSASFLASIKDSRAKRFGGIPDSLLKREDYLKMNISSYKEMLFEENQNSDPDSARIELFNSKIFQLNEQYEQLVQLFEDSFPNYYAFKYRNEVVDVASIQEHVNGKTAVVEYLIEEPNENKEQGQVYKFIITEDEVSFTKELIDLTFVEDIESVYQFLTSPKYLFTGLSEFKGYAKSAYQLYEVLLEKDKSLLEGKQLVVVPDDKLAYIPFDALLSEMPDTSKMNFRNLSYLVEDYSISYTYSATLLYNYFENEKQAENDLLAFAPSYHNDDRDYTVISEYRAGLLPLPAVTKEVDFISEYVSGDVFKDSLAQEAEFKKRASNYDILHLAMHTLINDTLPMYSKLAFSKPYLDETDDGWLNTNEIYTMDLKARMAVLSACNTGSGKLQKGEGVMSLARGFLYAGCPSIVMTLWEVEDESGAHIMKDFYRFLSKGKSKNEALRSAKLAHIKSADPLKAHPHYWLGYVVVGNPEPLFQSTDIYFVLIILLVILALFMDQYYRKKKTRD